MQMMKISNIRETPGPDGEKRQNRAEAVCEEITAKNFLKLIKDIKPQIRRALQAKDS